MIQPGMMFGGEGPIMQGTWYNPKTGDAFTVRDSFFEDNQYVVTTTDGRYLRYDQLQQYVQTDMKLEDIKHAHNKQHKNENIKESLPKEISNLIDDGSEDIYFGDNNLLLPEDMDLLNKPIHTTNMQQTQSNKLGNIYAPPVPNAAAPIDMNTTIIEKALKNTAKPNFSINVKWDNYPSKEIEMLKDIMDIPVTEIVDWYLDSIRLDEFIMAFKVAIDDKISFGNEYKEAEVKVIKVEEPVEIPTQEDKAEDKKDQPKQKLEKPTRAQSKDKKDKKSSKK